ncbi:MAG: hydroxymethylglutaryl-CoA synthase, partial [Flavobacteriales bacterium]|nr:hydroxymethylglutaryl-CoA synthase [Flavobacteriales bacterium]
LRLLQQNDIDPRTIGRIYMGTESALDAAKPTSTYMTEIVEKVLEGKYGKRSLKNCDVLDMTFACVGAVDALHNSVEWVRSGENRRAVVIASDNAKYALASTGEYTQGAGAVAVLVSEDPRMCEMSENVGVGMHSERDFYKPHHAFSKVEIAEKLLTAMGYIAEKEHLKKVIDSMNDDFWGHKDVNVFLHRDEPVFDGPLSNDCYCARITEALEHFSSMQKTDVLSDWDRIIFHQPYAYQGRRMIVSNWIQWCEQKGHLSEIEKEVGYAKNAENSAEFCKAASKTPLYRSFISQRVEKGERASSLIGNMYTGSVFMSLISLLRSEWEEKTDLTGKTIGCFTYGSGSKSKVFTLKVEPLWGQMIEKNDIFAYLAHRQKVDFDTYQSLHTGEKTSPLLAGKSISLSHVGTRGNTIGYRYYNVKKQ